MGKFISESPARSRRNGGDTRKGTCPNKGYRWTDAQKEKQRQICKRICTTNKRVVQIKDGVIVGTFNSITEAGTITGISFQNISSVCRGKRKSSGGYIWKFED